MSTIRPFLVDRVEEIRAAQRSTDFEAFADLGSEAGRRLTLIVLGAAAVLGGTIGTAAMLPYSDALGLPVSQMLAVGAALTGLGAIGLLLPGRTPSAVIEALFVGAVIAVSVAVWTGTGRVAGETVLFYFWAAVLAAMFRPKNATLVHFGAIALASGVVFALDDTFTQPLFWWVLVLLTLVVVWHSVGWLVRRARALAVSERSLRAAAERSSIELERANDRKSRFLARMSHELRTPMNAIVGFGEMLQRGIVGDLGDRQASYVDDIVASGRHLSLLIDDTLDEITVERGHHDLDARPADVRGLVDDAITFVRGQAADRDVEIVVGVEGVDLVRLDARKVTQVLTNLLSNAVRFSPSGTSVVVRVERCSGGVAFSVADHGPGIEPAHHESIFEEFSQTDGAEQRSSGTGLGLAVAREFVELHGGTIRVDSLPGRGARFTFTIPTDVPLGSSSPGRIRRRGPGIDETASAPSIVTVRELLRRSVVFSAAVVIGCAVGGLLIDSPDVNSEFLLLAAVVVAAIAILGLVGLWVLSPRDVAVLHLALMFGGAVATAVAFDELGPLAPAAVAVWLGQAFYVRLLFLKIDVPGTWGHLLIVAAGAGAVLWNQPVNEAPVAQWLAVVGTVWVGSSLVGWLLRRLQHIARGEHAAAEEATRIAAALETASRHKSQFLAGMSHELRTPLNAVIGCSEALAREIVGPLDEVQHEYVEHISESGRHLLGLINDVLDIARIDAGRLEVALARVDVGDVVADVIGSLVDVADHDVSVTAELTPGLDVWADRELLGRVVTNLVANALRFTPTGGSVTVATTTDGATTSIVVEDTGPGVDATDQAAIFEEFRLAERDPEQASDGVGLGLALARRLTRLHGGDLTVDSSPGAGASFRVTLPAEAPPEHPPRSTPQPLLEGTRP